MKITDVRVRPCLQRLRDASWKFVRATVPQLEGQLDDPFEDLPVAQGQMTVPIEPGCGLTWAQKPTH